MKYMSADEAMTLVKSGDWVFFQGSTSVPVILQEALARRHEELRDVQIVSGFNVTKGPAPFCKPEYKDSFVVNSLFLCADQRQYVAQGYGSLIPGFLSDLPALIRRKEIPIDVACINCSLPDENGYCSYNISADLAQPAVEAARVVIAQVNKSIPYLYGTAMIHESEITAAVECDDPPVDMQFGAPTEIEAAIGAHIAEEIPDGATLQIGVGGIPNATLNGLKDHKHLGLHTEAMTDGVFRLMQSGVIDNSMKKYEPGRSVASLALGSRQMYEFIDHNRDCVFFDVGVTNDPSLIRQNPKAVAINSAIEVDLTGQICADSIGEMIFSSVGGQHDFMYGASLSEGGKTFIAMPARTAKGRGKIVANLAPGAGVVTTRFQTQYVVTEYGCVYLRNKNLAQRAKALISIAHPDDREALERAALERFGYTYHRLSMQP
ncbi:MAG: 4-hydroxybutyrate CoA-transferase [Bacteroidales bacterium]|nr:4-hydroxybutyrate CoA-transferase [Bacteroidales bacterium]MBQ6185637.1 4-hydroxybutyrate CoA-transferase [Bacteroidales bacterium]